MRPPFIHRQIAACALVATLWAGGAAAMMPDPPHDTSPEYQAAETAVRQERFDDAIAQLSQITRKQPDDADAHTLLGYSYRKKGLLDRSAAEYRIARQLDPELKQAYEYYGELFLQRRDLPRAEEQLARLARLCPDGCYEKSQLESALRAYKAGS